MRTNASTSATFKKLPLFVCGLIFMASAVSGCIFVIGGAVGALGGYAVSQDTIQGETAKSYTSVWNAAAKVMSILGDVSLEDREGGTIEATVNASKVKVKIEEIVKGAVRLRVKARKHLLPDIKLSQKIYIKIIENATK